MLKKNVVILGAGKMGLGIAQLFACKGNDVKVVYAHKSKTRRDNVALIRGNLHVLVENDVLSEQQAQDALDKICFVESLEEVANFADIVFECIIEDLATKQEYFARMDRIFPESTILATNTSAISVTEIAEKAIHKERIIGTHFWNPPYLVPLVEVIRTQYVSSDIETATFELLKEAGKHPVLVKKDVPGFLANRMQHALFREALSIVENGIADPEDVDDAIRYGFGMRLGICPPIEVMDMGGLDLTYSIHKYLFPHIESSTTPSRLLTENLDQGNLGFTTGKGIMEWSQEDIDRANREVIEGLIKVEKALNRL